MTEIVEQHWTTSTYHFIMLVDWLLSDHIMLVDWLLSDHIMLVDWLLRDHINEILKLPRPEDTLQHRQTTRTGSAASDMSWWERKPMIWYCQQPWEHIEKRIGQTQNSVLLDTCTTLHRSLLPLKRHTLYGCQYGCGTMGDTPLLFVWWH